MYSQRVVKEEMGGKWTGVSRKCPHRGAVASSGFVSFPVRNNLPPVSALAPVMNIYRGVYTAQSYEMNTCLK